MPTQAEWDDWDQFKDRDELKEAEKRIERYGHYERAQAVCIVDDARQAWHKAQGLAAPESELPTTQGPFCVELGDGKGMPEPIQRPLSITALELRHVLEVWHWPVPSRASDILQTRSVGATMVVSACSNTHAMRRRLSHKLMQAHLIALMVKEYKGLGCM